MSTEPNFDFGFSSLWQDPFEAERADQEIFANRFPEILTLPEDANQVEGWTSPHDFAKSIGSPKPSSRSSEEIQAPPLSDNSSDNEYQPAAPGRKQPTRLRAQAQKLKAKIAAPKTGGTRSKKLAAKNQTSKLPERRVAYQKFNGFKGRKYRKTRQDIEDRIQEYLAVDGATLNKENRRRFLNKIQSSKTRFVHNVNEYAAIVTIARSEKLHQKLISAKKARNIDLAWEIVDQLEAGTHKYTEVEAQKDFPMKTEYFRYENDPEKGITLTNAFKNSRP